MVLIFVFILISPAVATEIVRQKNAATIITYPMILNTGLKNSGAGGLDSEIIIWTDTSAPGAAADCTNEATEIGSTGRYYLSLTQAEMNTDYILIYTASTTTNALDQNILIRTVVGDPLNLATTDDGGTINVTGGAIDTVTTTATATATTTVNGLAANVITSASIADGGITDADVANDVQVDVASISTDATAANNAELFFDGTGYAGTNNQGTVGILGERSGNICESNRPIACRT